MTRRSNHRAIGYAMVAALTLGALSTFGDWLWTNFIPDGAVVPGIVHGIVIFLAIGLVLAWTARREGADSRAARRLVIALVAAGGLIAAAFYPLFFLVLAIGRLFTEDAVLSAYLVSLLVTWLAMWAVVARLYEKARGDTERGRQVATRGTVAALTSGLAFWAISGIWTDPAPEGPNYLWHFACWSFAFLPGFLALLVARELD